MAVGFSEMGSLASQVFDSGVKNKMLFQTVMCSRVAKLGTFWVITSESPFPTRVKNVNCHVQSVCACMCVCVCEFVSWGVVF